MRITLFDDSVPFDGATPGLRALGGAEKALVGLAGALARRGHDVTVVNRCAAAATVEGVRWLPWDTPRPPQSDVAIAFRKPALLAELDDPGHRVLWMWGPPQALNKPDNQSLLDRLRPALVFVGDAHRRAWKSWRDFSETVVVPGVAAAYLNHADAAAGGAASRTAIVTTHPLNGLKQIVRLWRAHIRPQYAAAELQVYSAGLAHAAAGGKVDPRLADIAEEVAEAAEDGVKVVAPLPDAEMAAAYRAARVHLYPASATEMYCNTLAESQAAGLPAVVRLPQDVNAAAAERVRNGQTGYLVPDDEAFANVTLEVLTNDPLHETLSRDARTLQAGRGWDAAALDFEMAWAAD